MLAHSVCDICTNGSAWCWRKLRSMASHKWSTSLKSGDLESHGITQILLFPEKLLSVRLYVVWRCHANIWHCRSVWRGGCETQKGLLANLVWMNFLEQASVVVYQLYEMNTHTTSPANHSTSYIQCLFKLSLRHLKNRYRSFAQQSTKCDSSPNYTFLHRSWGKTSNVFNLITRRLHMWTRHAQLLNLSHSTMMYIPHSWKNFDEELSTVSVRSFLFSFPSDDLIWLCYQFIQILRMLVYIFIMISRCTGARLSIHIWVLDTASILTSWMAGAHLYYHTVGSWSKSLFNKMESAACPYLDTLECWRRLGLGL